MRCTSVTIGETSATRAMHTCDQVQNYATNCTSYLTGQIIDIYYALF
jgi:hypothetical protein